MTDTPNCYKCPFRREVPGSAHSSCTHPSLGEPDPLKELASILGGRLPASLMQPLPADRIRVTGDEYGIRKGWFAWPYNFDPTWLRTCTGYVAKEEVVQ